MLDRLRTKIEAREATIAVIGLGYVGLPVACTFASAGFSVTGVDIQEGRVQQINDGRSPIAGQEPGLADLLASVVSENRFRATTDYGEIRDADIVLINVETPVDADRGPSYEALRAALASAGRVLQEGALLIIESTIAPGTMDGLVRPLLETVSGKREQENFFLGHCPERVMPGKLLANIAAMSRVCGGSSPEVAGVMVALYRTIVQAELDPTDCVTAELAKTMENAYRDVQIAFANEMALLCEGMGADVWQVRELVNKSPGRNMLLPGAGVGGHCIPKDGLLLIANAPESFSAQLIPAARSVNNNMPHHMVTLTNQALEEVGLNLSKARIIILGYAYLANSDDTRNSPSEVTVAQLRAEGAEVLVHDPFVAAYQGELLEMAQGCDAVLVMVGHQAYVEMDWAKLLDVMRSPVVIDGRHLLKNGQVVNSEIVYRGVGVGSAVKR